MLTVDVGRCLIGGGPLCRREGAISRQGWPVVGSGPAATGSPKVKENDELLSGVIARGCDSLSWSCARGRRDAAPALWCNRPMPLLGGAGEGVAGGWSSVC